MTSIETGKHVYPFIEAARIERSAQRRILGGKGAGLAEMTALGIPVPPGFTITTDACAWFEKTEGEYAPGLQQEIDAALTGLEARLGKRLGSAADPLLVSVRSGAAASMPGMMDTVLNIGLNEATRLGMEKRTGNPRFAWDTFRRFVQMFGETVRGIPAEAFERLILETKRKRGVTLDTELDAEALQEVTLAFLQAYRQRLCEEFPSDPRLQLRLAVDAVFRSWNNERAVTYRRLNQIRGLSGTAVTVQAMVFGNMGETSGSGVCFTRDPATGERIFYGEFLPNAQGEDVVAGTRTPLPIARLEEHIPGVLSELLRVRDLLETHFRDMQDIEFTVENGTLHILQTRAGKRTGNAAVRIAVEMVREGLIDTSTALRRLDPSQLEQILHPTFDPKVARDVVGRGIPASPGAASGRACFTAESAEDLAARGEAVILVRDETSPEDIGGMHASKGILTARGGKTSHAAVVGRGMGKTCVVGCDRLQINLEAKTASLDGYAFVEGDEISLDGTSGEVMRGRVATVPPSLSDDFKTVMSWADARRRLGVRANADTPADCRKALEFGAEGVGLCRTEHMFFEGERIRAVREMILASDEEGRRHALTRLLPMQRGDFVEIFRVMAGLPVTIRLLDPPLHEFLPMETENRAEMAREMSVSADVIAMRVEKLREVNPMLGHRGCRLGISHPEIYEMQVRALLEAAHQVSTEGVRVLPEIMVPLVATVTELTPIKEMVLRVAAEIEARTGAKVAFQVGTMIEVPRAALTAGRIAEQAEFFSFGTNDLTQMTFGFSRDDIGSFIGEYFERSILEDDPFSTIDQEGVGELMKIAVTQGRRARPGLKIGICGESGGESRSVKFCHRLGMDYVSCSPFRVPLARLAAAQASLEDDSR